MSRPCLLLALCSLLAAAPAGAARKRGIADAPRSHGATQKTGTAPLTGSLASATLLTVSPAALNLDGPNALRHFIVTATLPGGETYDVTDRAAFALSSPGLARLSDGVLYPLADGAGRLVATLGKLSSAP